MRTSTTMTLDDFSSSCAVKRKLRDGTLVTQLSKAEYELLGEFFLDCTKYANRKCFRGYYESPNEANPQVVSMLAWRPYLEAVARSVGGALVFAAPYTAAAFLDF